jgi:sporulation protein YlmC with PRC-barrel domain
MSQTRMFRLGAEVGCADGECGKLKSVVINPGDDTVTHLVVEPAHRQGFGKLVPLRLVRTAVSGTDSGEVRLDCTMAEFGRLDPAEATYLSSDVGEPGIRPGESGASWPYYAPPGVMGGPGLPGDLGQAAQAITVDTVPDQLPGEEETSRGEHVHATDGDIGHVQGIAVDPGTGRVTHVHLRMGHLWRRKAVLIPRSAIAEVDADGFHLNISAQEVHSLPPADTDHPLDKLA